MKRHKGSCEKRENGIGVVGVEKGSGHSGHFQGVYHKVRSSS
jgi:hypothetical protein